MALAHYAVTLLAPNTELPPLFQSREVQPGRTETLDFLLPATTSLLRVYGKDDALHRPAA